MCLMNVFYIDLYDNNNNNKVVPKAFINYLYRAVA